MIVNKNHFKRILTNVNNQVHFIELGGCGIFSYLLYNRFKKHNINTEIVYVEGGKNNKYNIPFTHILLKIDNLIIDNKGIYEYNGLKEINPTILKEMIDDKDIWNNTFHRGYLDSNFNWVDPKKVLEEKVNQIVDKIIDKNIVK